MAAGISYRETVGGSEVDSGVSLPGGRGKFAERMVALKTEMVFRRSSRSVSKFPSDSRRRTTSASRVLI